MVPRPVLGQAKSLQLAPLAPRKHRQSAWIVLVGSQRCQNDTRITPNMHGRIFTRQMWVLELEYRGAQSSENLAFFAVSSEPAKTPPKNSHFFHLLAIQRTKPLWSTWFFIIKKVCRSISSYVHFYDKWVGGTRKILQPQLAKSWRSLGGPAHMGSSI